MAKGKEDIYDGGKRLPLVEAFYTIQGEGFHTGKPAYFLRIGGCDVGCAWCDTKFSWNAEIHELTPIEDIIPPLIDSGADSVVVTGGEPLTYPMGPLCEKFREAGMKTFLETSGAYPLSGDWDWICLSPKRNMPPTAKVLEQADELKVVIYEEKDYDWAEENAAKAGPDCRLFLQPEWSRYEEHIPELVEYVKANPKWSISLQSHKFMHIP